MRKASAAVLLTVAALAALLYGRMPAAGGPDREPAAFEAMEVATQPAVVVRPPAVRDTTFAGIIARISEPDGYFDSDNLISNESSYLHVLGAMRTLGVSGGAYIGVGPDQNFTYIAQVRPDIAFIIDIRRDNLVQHLLFKSLFAMASTRIEYLALLFGRPVPADAPAWKTRSAEQLVRYIDEHPVDSDIVNETINRVRGRAQSYGVPLTEKDLQTLHDIHVAFAGAGMGLKFTSTGRTARPYYPTFRDLVLERDRSGRLGNYLTREEDFAFVKSMEDADRIIPVVGDLAGDHALTEIARYLDERNQRVSAFYASNVEFYLMMQRTFDEFAENMARLPIDGRSVIIRSLFARGDNHPQAVPGYYSTQLLQTIESLVSEYRTGGYGSYSDLVSKHIVPAGG
jgi:hypothetical protein